MSKQNTENGVWILTEEYNAYDQHGRYFVAAFKKRPTLLELADYFKYTTTSASANFMAAISFLEGLLSGGGRRGNEDSWYNLEFIEYAKPECNENF